MAMDSNLHRHLPQSPPGTEALRKPSFSVARFRTVNKKGPHTKPDKLREAFMATLQTQRPK